MIIKQKKMKKENNIKKFLNKKSFLNLRLNQEVLDCKTVADLLKTDINKIVETESRVISMPLTTPGRDGRFLPLEAFDACFCSSRGRGRQGLRFWFLISASCCLVNCSLRLAGSICSFIFRQTFFAGLFWELQLDSLRPGFAIL